MTAGFRPYGVTQGPGAHAVDDEDLVQAG
jgi:hypothetical protein